MIDILIVEDNLYLANTIQIALRNESISADLAARIKTAYQKLDQKHYEVVIVDRILPDGDGLELIELIANDFEDTKTIIISQNYEVEDRVMGLETGADAYISKPFSLKELLFKLDKVRLLKKNHSTVQLQCGSINLYPDEGVLMINGQRIQVRKKECMLLACLLRNKNRVVSRETIIKNVWGIEETPTKSTIDVYIKRVRNLLKNYNYIDTVRGYGYVIRDQ